MKLPVLYHRSNTGAIVQWECWTEGPEVFVRWGQIDGAMQTQSTTSKPKNLGKVNATSGVEQATKDAESKWKKQKKDGYKESVEEASKAEEIRPMLAQDFSKRKGKIKFPVCVQPKLDGLRCLAYLKDGKVVLQSRGSKFYSLPHIEKSLEPLLKALPGCIFDGELYLHGVSLQTLNSWIRKNQPDSLKIEYHIYDVADLTQPFSVRYYQNLWQSGDPQDNDSKIRYVYTVTANSEDEVIEHQKFFVEKGYEGAIVRVGGCTYKYDYRSPELLKVKNWIDSEFKILGHKTGLDGLPVFICQNDLNEETFDVRPKGCTEERRQMLEEAPSSIGKWMKVKYFDRTDNNLPHYPVGLGIRDESDMS